MQTSPSIHFKYKFLFQDNSKVNFDINLDRECLALVRDADEKPLPDWARLEVERCPNCPLDPSKDIYCPVAGNISHIAERFGGHFSYEPIELEVETENRKYLISTTLQRGISAMMGIYMVISGCPIMDKLRPMVRYHLPVATLDETRYRAVSMYLMAQFFIQREKAGDPDWNLKNLGDIYEGIKVVNRAFVKRLSHATKKDASLNAVVILNHFADFIPFAIDDEMFEEMKPVFSAYLDGYSKAPTAE